MAQTIKLKRTATPSNVPTTAQLELGEIAVNTYDGNVYIKKNDGADAIVKINANPSDLNYFMNGAGTVAGTWLGTDPDITSYYDGLVIWYRITVAGASTTTLNINGLGAKTIYRYNTTKLTTHWPVNSVIPLVYVAALNGGSFIGGYDWSDGNQSYDLRWSSSVVNGSSIIHGYQLLMEGADTKFYPVTVGGVNNSATNVVQTAPLRIGGQMLYYNTTTDVAINAVIPDNVLYESIESGDGEYWMNRSSSSSWTSAGLPLYIVGTVNANNELILDNSTTTAFLTNALPTTEDGKIYIHIGYSDNEDDLWRLSVTHPIFEFKAGEIRRYTPALIPSEVLDAIKTVDGASSGLDADLLDGQQGSYYAPASHNHTGVYLPIAGKAADSNLLDGIDSASFLRSDATDTASGIITFSNASNATSTASGAVRITGGLGVGYNVYANAFLRQGNTVWDAGNDGSGSGLDADLLDGIDSTRVIYGSNSSGTNEGNISDWNAISKTGFYSHSAATNRWSSAVNWSSVLHFKLYDDNNSYSSQMGFNTYDNRMYARTNSAGVWTGWDEFWTSGNDGSGSGLDADLLDGQQGSYYYPASNPSGYNNYTHPAYTARSLNTTGAQVLDILTTDAIGSVTNATTRTMTLADLGYTGATNANYITNNNQLTNGAGYTTSINDRVYITDTRGAVRAPSYYDDRYAQWDFQNTADTGVGGDSWHALLTVSKWASYDPSHRQEQLIFSGDHLWRRTATSDAVWGTSKKIWDSGNDGSGSTLDADLLDGQQGSYYYPASNPNGYTNDQTAAEILTAIKTVDGASSGLDADLLDGQQGSYYATAASVSAIAALDPVITLTGAVTGTGTMTNLGNVSIATTATSDPVITLTGAVTGSGTMTNLGNVSIATTATADPVLTLTGDVTGSATFTNLGNATLTAVVANDSHTHSIYAPIKRGSATISNAGWTTVCTVDGDALGSSVRMTVAGTGASTVISSILDIVCNHSLDIMVTSQTSTYTTLYVKIVSNNNEDFAVQLKTNSANSLPVNIEVFPLNNETVTFTSTNPYTGATLEHECMNGGFASSSSGGAAHGFYSNGSVLATAASVAAIAALDPVITLTGAVTGSGTMTNLGNVSITTTNTADPVLTLTGDVTGSATFTNLGNATLTAVVADDSHNHIISNVDGLQTALNSKLNLSGGTLTGTLAMGANAITSTGTISSGAITSTGNVSLNQADGFVYLNNQGVGNAGIYVRGITSSSTLRSHSTNNFRWEVSGSQKMELNSSGVLNAVGGYQVNATTVIDSSRNLTNVNLVKFREQDASFYISPTNTNTLNAQYGSAADTADMWINYRGYQDGQAYFRDFRIGNGKGTALLFVDGSAKAFDFQSDSVIQMNGTTVIDASRNLTNIGTLNGGTPWTSANDGSGSGLDADLLDGRSPSISATAYSLALRDGSANLLGNISTATTLETARTINGVSFNGSANITVEPYIEDDEGTDATRLLVFTDNTTAGFKRLNEDSGLTYNPFNDLLRSNSINAANFYVGTATTGAYITSPYTLGNLGLNAGSTAYNVFIGAGATNYAQFSNTLITHYKRLVSAGGTTQTAATPNIQSIAQGSGNGVTQYHINFCNSGQTVHGRITSNNFATTYATTSDYRVKEDVQEMEGATERLLQLNPVNFKWKGSELRTDGFLAHEVDAIVPDAVVGEKDATETVVEIVVDEEGNETEVTKVVDSLQALDQAKLIPLLVKTIQELEARIKLLESK
jgi:hypothetical protein